MVSRVKNIPYRRSVALQLVDIFLKFGASGASGASSLAYII